MNPEAAPSVAYTVAGLTGARWISRISPWCTVATGPLSQAIVAASQLIFGDAAAISGIAAPINAATLLETFGFGGSHRPLPLMPCHRRAVFQPLLCVRLCVAPPFRLSSSVFPPRQCRTAAISALQTVIRLESRPVNYRGSS